MGFGLGRWRVLLVDMARKGGMAWHSMVIARERSGLQWFRVGILVG
jgi:hypothetical protein